MDPLWKAFHNCSIVPKHPTRASSRPYRGALNATMYQCDEWSGQTGPPQRSQPLNRVAY
jgi:hypothetical protein